MFYQSAVSRSFLVSRLRFHNIGFLALIVVFLCRTTTAQDEIFHHVTPGGSSGDRETQLWIPPNTETVRGILIYGNGAGDDSTDEVFTPWNQRFAEVHDFAVIGTGFWGNISVNEIDIWDEHLDALAEKSGRPELVNAPWAPIGFSNGGQMSYGFNSLRPEKVIAFITNKGCCYNDRLPSEAALATPGVLIAGELDTEFRRDSIRGLFEDNRARGALWSWVEQEGEEHSGRADEIILPFMEESIRLRYPEDELPTATTGVTLKDLNESDGWLADQSTWKSGLTEVSSFDDYAGDRSTAGWLLNENMAFLYRAFSTYNKNVSFDLPSAPEVFLGELFTDKFPVNFDLTIDTAAVPDWSKIELFNYAEKIGELNSTGTPQTHATFEVTLQPGDVHALSSMVTGANGIDISTTNILAVLTSEIPGPMSPEAIYITIDNDSDGVFDNLGDKVVDHLTRARTQVGEDDRSRNHVRRLVAKFELLDAPVDTPFLESATLWFFLQDILGTPAGPLSLLHSITDNDLDKLASDFENPSYVDTLLDMVQPTDPVGQYYKLDVTDLVLADYAADGLDPLSAFRLEVSEAVFFEDDSGRNSYRLHMPALVAKSPQLVLTFTAVPEPSTLTLAALTLLGLLAHGHRRRRA